MNVIILTDKNVIVEHILKHFSESKINIDAIVIEEQPAKTIVAKIKKNLPVFIINFFRRIRGFAMVRATENSKNYKQFSKKVFVVDNFNSAEALSIVKELQPDLIVLGGSRILKQPIITVPKIGILNAHPGMLPKYRGANVLLWSVYQNDPIGVTVHFIDKGIDTGKICEQKEIKIEKNDTVKSLRLKANIESGRLLAKVVTDIMNNTLGPMMDNPIEAGKQYYQMDKKRVEEVNQKLKNYAE